jgi:hypothetical protein
VFDLRPRVPTAPLTPSATHDRVDGLAALPPHLSPNPSNLIGDKLNHQNPNPNSM